MAATTKSPFPPKACSRCNALPRMNCLPCVFLCEPCYKVIEAVNKRVNRGRRMDRLPVIAARGRTITDRPGHAGPTLPGTK